LKIAARMDEELEQIYVDTKEEGGCGHLSL
jgi:hypothetical protein